MQSDHHPLLVNLAPKLKRVGERPFRFEATWFNHKEFDGFVKEKWGAKRETWEALEHLEGDLKIWNDQVFGHINQKKRELLNRINGIQKKLQEGTNEFLEKLEQELQLELRDVLWREEMLWFQKARTKWIQDGDRNTSYYHAKTKIHRRRETE